MGGCTINNGNFNKYLGTYWVGGLVKKFEVLSTLFRLCISTLNVDPPELVSTMLPRRESTIMGSANLLSFK